MRNQSFNKLLFLPTIFMTFWNVITRSDVDNNDPHKRVAYPNTIILTCIINH